MFKPLNPHYTPFDQQFTMQPCFSSRKTKNIYRSHSKSLETTHTIIMWGLVGFISWYINVCMCTYTWPIHCFNVLRSLRVTIDFSYATFTTTFTMVHSQPMLIKCFSFDLAPKEFIHRKWSYSYDYNYKQCNRIILMYTSRDTSCVLTKIQSEELICYYVKGRLSTFTFSICYSLTANWQLTQTLFHFLNEWINIMYVCKCVCVFIFRNGKDCQLYNNDKHVCFSKYLRMQNKTQKFKTATTTTTWIVWIRFISPIYIHT